MNLLPDDTWQHVRALLVDEEYARRIASGTIDKGRLRALIGGDVDTQRDDIPGWDRQQADRLLGEVRRPSRLAECPGCELPFNPDQPPEPVTLTFEAPLHPRWTNGTTYVAVPPEHEDAYRRLGYALLAGDDGAALPPVTVHDYPTRGADGLLYCRATCATAGAGWWQRDRAQRQERARLAAIGRTADDGPRERLAERAALAIEQHPWP